jgi:putative transposase
MSHLIRKNHNVSILVYHFVCPAKYRKAVIDEQFDQVLRDVRVEIANRYQIESLEIAPDKDYMRFLVQSVPSYSPTKLITIIKGLTARGVFARVLSIKKQLWGGEFWTNGYYLGAVGQHATEEVLRQYVKNQGQEKEYVQLHAQQLRLFYRSDTPSAAAG